MNHLTIVPPVSIWLPIFPDKHYLSSSAPEAGFGQHIWYIHLFDYEEELPGRQKAPARRIETGGPQQETVLGK